MPFKLSNLNLNLALTRDYLNPALNNSAQECSQAFFVFFFVYAQEVTELLCWENTHSLCYLICPNNEPHLTTQSCHNTCLRQELISFDYMKNPNSTALMKTVNNS